MERLARIRFFCSHNSFEIYDSAIDWLEEPSELEWLDPEEQEARLLRGWYRRGRCIVYRTLAGANDHRIDVYRASQARLDEDADRIIVHNLSLPSGTLVVMGLDNEERVEVDAGDYVVQCRAYNIGVELSCEHEIEDDEAFLARDDLERYELILTPGHADREGVVFGPPTLDAFDPRAI